MADTQTSHITLSYRQNAVDVTSTYAVDEAILREAQIWLGQQKTMGKNPSGYDFKEWLKNIGCKLDSSDGPAIVKHFNDGSTEESYYRDGKQHREDGPACVRRGADGSTSEAYWHNGQLDRQDGPAFIRGFADGSTEEEYYQGGKLHRENGPAVLGRYADGSTMQRYYRDGKKHRDNGPAYVSREANGQTVEEYYRDGRFLRREDLAPLSAIPGVTVRPPAPRASDSPGASGPA